MPKKKIKLLVRAYAENNIPCGEVFLDGYSHDEIFKEFLTLVDILASGKFSYLNRLDLVSSGRVLFSFCDLRKTLDQKNIIINFNPY